MTRCEVCSCSFVLFCTVARALKTCMWVQLLPAIYIACCNHKCLLLARIEVGVVSGITNAHNRFVLVLKARRLRLTVVSFGATGCRLHFFLASAGIFFLAHLHALLWREFDLRARHGRARLLHGCLCWCELRSTT